MQQMMRSAGLKVVKRAPYREIKGALIEDGMDVFIRDQENKLYYATRYGRHEKTLYPVMEDVPSGQNEGFLGQAIVSEPDKSKVFDVIDRDSLGITLYFQKNRQKILFSPK